MIAKFVNKGILNCLFSTAKLQPLGKYSQKYTKARTSFGLYNLSPVSLGNIFVAPTATIVGEVFLGHQVSIWHGTVIRGDINAVMIHTNIYIGNNCVLHTAASTTSGLSAVLEIQDDCVVQSGSTLYSCTLRERSFIGYNSVVLEGAIIQYGAIIAPNSVVPPGRVVPSMQVWGGNPIKFIRNVKQQEAYVTTEEARQNFRNTYAYREQFLPYNNAYLFKQNQQQQLEYQKTSETNFEQKYRASVAYDPLKSTMN